MRIYNAKDPDISLKLIPWFVPGNQTPIDIGWELHERLREKPDETFCSIAIENDTIQAVLIAYVRKREVWLWQAQSRSGFKYSKYIFEGLKHWSRSRGRKKIRMGTPTRHKAFERAWGFKKCRWDKNVMEVKL
jgi:hypothetical protein